MKRGLAACLVLLGAVVLDVGRNPAAGQEVRLQPRTDILQLVSQTSMIEPDGDLTMRVRVTGAPGGARVHVEVHNRVPTRSDFRATLTGKLSRTRVGAAVEVPAIPDASGIVVATVGTRDPQSALPSDAQHVRIGEGVYPVSVDLLSSSGSVLDSLVSYLVRLPAGREFGPLGVAIVLPIGGRPALQPDGTTALDPTTAQSVLSNASVLEAHAASPITIAATPESIDALDTATNTELRKAVVGRQLSLTPYVRIRPTEWLAAGLGREMAREFDRGESALRTKLAAPDPTTYIADNRLTTEAARALQLRGVRSIVVPEGAMLPLDDRVFNRTLTQPFVLNGIDGVKAVAADAGLSAHAGETGDPVLDANHLLADLAVLYFDDPPDKRAAVVAFGDDQHVDPQMLDALLSGLDPTTNRIMQPTTLATMFSSIPSAGSKGETNGRGTPLTRTLTPTLGANLSTFADDLRVAEGDLDSYRRIVTTDNPRPDEFERRALVAGSVDLSELARVAYLDGMRAGVRAETSKIQAPARQTINFTARDGVVSLTVRNTTGYTVKVGLRLQGEKLEFPGHENGAMEVTLTQETTRVPLNVRTRASGDSPLDITLSAPDGHLVIGRTRITVRSTAFSGVGIILSVGAGTFLAVWWLRHALTTRRERRRRIRHAAGDRAREA
jgi:hypothetical protein